MQLALSAKNIPADLKEICERINVYYPSKRRYENWYWRIPYSAERFAVPYDMAEEEIIKQLDAQFAVLMDCEKNLIQEMNNE